MGRALDTDEQTFPVSLHIDIGHVIEFGQFGESLSGNVDRDRKDFCVFEHRGVSLESADHPAAAKRVAQLGDKDNLQFPVLRC